MIFYQVEVADAAAHQFRVTVTVANPAPIQGLSLPAWIPGSYMLREFSRHLSALQARQEDRARPITQLAKNRWAVTCSGHDDLVITYLVYAFDPTVRTAWLTEERGFFNTPSLCLVVDGRAEEQHRMALRGLPQGWDVATAMPRAAVGAPNEHVYESQDYDEFADHPFELGQFWRGKFKCRDVVHEFVVSGADRQFDGNRLLDDTRRICEEEIRFWHGDGAPPFDRYVFMLHATENGWGGLEHRNSTALIASRKNLPRRNVEVSNDAYLRLLGLISHEYFHAWNVKRLKPAEFSPCDLSKENYTQLLWFFEGFTSYYDDRVLLNCGLIDQARYLELLARAMNNVRQAPGQRLQSVSEASFDAWTKYYHRDENTPNATVCYYAKGSMVALRLDLEIRGTGMTTLDDVMRALWTDAPQGIVTQELIHDTVLRLCGHHIADKLLDWIHQREDIDVETALASVGITAHPQPLDLATELGIRLADEATHGLQIKAVLAGGAGARAGLSAGDEIVAIDGWRARCLDDVQQYLATGETLDILFSRQQRVRSARIPERSDEQRKRASTRMLDLCADPDPATAARRDTWLSRRN